MKKRFKRLLTAALATLMCVSSLNLTSFAEEGPANTAKVSNLVNKTATALNENNQADVTLSVPGGQMDYSSDIVMVLGESPTDDHSYITDTIKKMLTATDGTPTKIKFGLVTYSDTTEKELVLPLTEMRDTDPNNEALDDMDVIIANALKEAKRVGIGVNLESALNTARDLLAADTEVPAERKHMIVITTGLAYYFDDDNGQACTIIGSNGYGDYMHSYKYWLKARNNSTNTQSGYKIPTWAEVKENGVVNYQASWEKYWGMVVEWIAADQNKYVYDLNGQTYSEFLTAGGTMYGKNYTEYPASINNSSGKRYGHALTDANDIAAVKNAVPYFTGGANPADNANAAHALNYERGQYEAYVVYKQMDMPIGETFTTVLKDENGENIVVDGLGYNCYAITNGASKNPGEEDRWLESNQIGYNFVQQLAGGKAIHYRDKDNTFFEPIENKILYTCSIGSTVEDFIGYGYYNEDGDFEANGNFEFIQDAAAMTLVAGGRTYTTTQVETKEGYDSSYAFTAPGATEPTFWLDYYYGDGKTTEKFIWTFGENVSMANRASLTYKLQLTEKVEAEGDYNVRTNNSATLYPKDSEGNPGEPQVFPVPYVTYFAGERLITFSKTTSIGEGTTKITYPLEGIQFEVYYAGTVDEYTKYMEDYAKANTGDTLVDEKAIQDAFTVEKAKTVTAEDKVGTVITDINGNAVCNINKNGVYLIKELPHPAIVKPVDPFVVAVPMVDAEGELTYVIPVNPKNDVLPGPEVEKNVTAIGTEIDSFAVGDVVTWILRGGIPVDIAGGKYYEMYDVLEDSLDYAGILKVVAGATNVAEGEESTVLGEEDYIVFYDDTTRTVKFELTTTGMQKAAAVITGNNVDADGSGSVDYKDVEIRVYLQTEMNEKAMVGGKIPNQVKLEYRNSVNFYFEDVDDAAAYTCGVRIYKYDAKNKETALAGAKFILAKAVAEGTDGAVQLVTKNNGVVNVVYEDFYTAVEDGELTGLSTEVTTDEYGEAKLYGLDAGEYYLVETKAPEGYNLLSYPVEITVSQNSDDTPIEVANSNQFKLPATGGIGTLVFKICGGVLIVAAVVILLTKKRMKNNE